MARPTFRGLSFYACLLLAASVWLTALPLSAQQGRMSIGSRLDEHDNALDRHDKEISALRGELSEVRAELSAYGDRLDRLSRQTPPPSASSGSSTTTATGTSSTALDQLRQQVQAFDAALAELQRQVRQLRQRGVGTPSPSPRGGDCCGEVSRLREHLADVRLMLETQATAITHLEVDVRRLGQEDALAQLEARAQELQVELTTRLEQIGELMIFSRTTGGGLLAVQNSQQQKAGSLFAFESGNGGLQINNAEGQRRLLLSVDDAGNGTAYVYNSEGELTLSLSGEGKIVVNGKNIADHAEVFELAGRDGIVPGTVLAVTDEGRLAPSSQAYDPRVVGVVSGAGGLRPGLVLGTREDGSSDLPVALNGQVYVRVSDEGGPVRPGDLLVPSSRPGVAMRAADRQRAFGAVLGKALESFAGGDGTTGAPGAEGLVRMLVMAR